MPAFRVLGLGVVAACGFAVDRFGFRRFVDLCYGWAGFGWQVGLVSFVLGGLTVYFIVVVAMLDWLGC